MLLKRHTSFGILVKEDSNNERGLLQGDSDSTLQTGDRLEDPPTLCQDTVLQQQAKPSLRVHIPHVRGKHSHTPQTVLISTLRHNPFPIKRRICVHWVTVRLVA